MGLDIRKFVTELTSKHGANLPLASVPELVRGAVFLLDGPMMAHWFEWNPHTSLVEFVEEVISSGMNRIFKPRFGGGLPLEVASVGLLIDDYTLVNAAKAQTDATRREKRRATELSHGQVNRRLNEGDASGFFFDASTKLAFYKILTDHFAYGSYASVAKVPHFVFMSAENNTPLLKLLEVGPTATAAVTVGGQDAAVSFLQLVVDKSVALTEAEVKLLCTHEITISVTCMPNNTDAAAAAGGGGGAAGGGGACEDSPSHGEDSLLEVTVTVRKSMGDTPMTDVDETHAHTTVIRVPASLSTAINARVVNLDIDDDFKIVITLHSLEIHDGMYDATEGKNKLCNVAATLSYSLFSFADEPIFHLNSPEADTHVVKLAIDAAIGGAKTVVCVCGDGDWLLTMAFVQALLWCRGFHTRIIVNFMVPTPDPAFPDDKARKLPCSFYDFATMCEAGQGAIQSLLQLAMVIPYAKNDNSGGIFGKSHTSAKALADTFPPFAYVNFGTGRLVIDESRLPQFSAELMGRNKLPRYPKVGNSKLSVSEEEWVQGCCVMFRRIEEMVLSTGLYDAFPVVPWGETHAALPPRPSIPGFTFPVGEPER